jgi:hypothetical protein
MHHAAPRCESASATHGLTCGKYTAETAGKGRDTDGPVTPEPYVRAHEWREKRTHDGVTDLRDTALHGVIARIRDLTLPLISLRPKGDEE